MIVNRSIKYGNVPYAHLMGDYDRMMYQDDPVRLKTVYYYRVCAMDAAGQRGPFSDEVVVRAKELP
jgi:hypothetical protein